MAKPTIQETRVAIEDLNPLNETHVKKLALYYAQTLRPSAGFERVSRKFITRIMYHTLTDIKDAVQRHPTRGKTLM